MSLFSCKNHFFSFIALFLFFFLSFSGATIAATNIDVLQRFSEDGAGASLDLYGTGGPNGVELTTKILKGRIKRASGSWIDLQPPGSLDIPGRIGVWTSIGDVLNDGKTMLNGRALDVSSGSYLDFSKTATTSGVFIDGMGVFQGEALLVDTGEVFRFGNAITTGSPLATPTDPNIFAAIGGPITLAPPEDCNIEFGQRYAEGPFGYLVDLRTSCSIVAGEIEGVVVTKTNITGMMWSETFGWIDMQPANPTFDPNVGVKVLYSNTNSKKTYTLSGLAWNNAVGWIDFGPKAGTKGVMIDENGFFQGVAWSDTFGGFNFGDDMLKNGLKTFQSPLTTSDQRFVSWARTTTLNRPPRVVLLDPISNGLASRTPIFSFRLFDPDGDQMQYEIEVERASNKKWVAAVNTFVNPADFSVGPNFDGGRQSLPATTLFPTGMTEFPPGDYRWRMRAFDGEDLSAWTNYETTTIGNTGPVITLNPLAVGNRTPNFSFSITDAENDPFSYFIEISRTADFSDIVVTASDSLATGGSFSFTPLQNLPAGTLYWRVRANDGDPNIPETIADGGSFAIGNGVPTIDAHQLRDGSLIIPNGGSTKNPSPTLYWKVSDTDSLPNDPFVATINIKKKSDNSLVQNIVTGHLRDDSPTLVFPALPLDNYFYELTVCDKDGSCTTVQADFSVVIPTNYGNIGTINIPNSSLYASETVINKTNNKFAWDGLNGEKIDFNKDGGGVLVTSEFLYGHAQSPTLGWIRMTCKAFPAEYGLPVSDECATRSYAVVNDGSGALSGRAFVASSAGSSAEVYLDFTGVSIGADGRFSGVATYVDATNTPTGGTVSFSPADIAAAGGPALATAEDEAVISEWIPLMDAPILRPEKYLLTAAQDEYSFWIAEKNPNPSALFPSCQNTDIQMQQVDSNGVVIRHLLPDVDFRIECDHGGEKISDGKIWIHLLAKKDGGVSTKPGLYRFTGKVGTRFNSAALSATAFADPSPNLLNEYVLQIVSAVPDMNMTAAMQTETFDSLTVAPDFPRPKELIADGEDTIRFSFRPVDRYGNPLFRVYQYEDNTKAIIKTVDMRILFRDEVAMDQLDANLVSFGTTSSVLFSAVDTLPNPPGKLSSEYHSFGRQNIVDTTPVVVDISSVAPTSSLNQLRLVDISVEVNLSSGSNGFINLGETNGPMLFPYNTSLSFLPIVSAEVSQFENLVFTNGIPHNIAITLKNRSNTVPINDYEWGGLARTQTLSGIRGVGNFVNTALDYSGATSLSTHDSYQNSSNTGSTSFPVGSESNFSASFYNLLEKNESPTIPIISSLFPSTLAPGSAFSFFFTVTPDIKESVLTEMAHLSQFFATYTNGRLIKFPLSEILRTSSLSSASLSVTGTVHGEDVDESNIQNGETFDDLSVVDGILRRNEILEIMYKNYNALVSGASPPKSASGSQTTIVLKNYGDLIAASNSGSARALQKKSVFWFEDDTESDLSVVLGEQGTPFDIPPGKGPITILVRGGNIVLNENIFLDTKTNLGIISLSSRKNAESGKEGNIFLAPHVTHIEGVLFAEGSLMSAKDFGGLSGKRDDTIVESEIYDGFSSNGEWKVSDFGNQFYLKGSISSRNILGTASEGIADTHGFWVSSECRGEGLCTTDSEREKMARRFDFLVLRSFHMAEIFDDADSDGIKDAADCDANGNSGCSEIMESATVGTGRFYNPLCEVIDPVALVGKTDTTLATFAANCVPVVIARAAANGGKCAEGTPWCQDGGGVTKDPFRIDDTSSYFNNPKVRSAVVIEYDRKIEDITPLGMEMPSEFTISE